jgi:hypothetical protein
MGGSAAEETLAELRSFELVFEAVSCGTCGETVAVAHGCTCGAQPPRPDGNVARRVAAIADIRAELDAPASPSDPIELGELTDALSSWIAELFDGLNRLGSPDADASALRAAVVRLVGLRARALAVPRHRPWLALWDPMVALLAALARLAATEIEAATAPDPDAAKASETIAQSHLDEAAKQIGLVDDRLEWWGIEHTIRLPDSIITAASVAYDSTGAQDIVDLDRLGKRLYERISRRAAGPTGIGVGLLLDLGLADRAFDEDRLYDVARLVYERLDRNREAFAALLDDAGWRADLLHARRLFYESQLGAETLLRELAGERRMEASTVLHLGAQITEGVSGTLLGLVLAPEAQSSLKRTSPYDAVHIVARASGLGDAMEGFDDRVRNADAHQDFDVGPDYVILGRHHAKPVKVSDADLVDIVLASLESCAALFAAIDCIAAEEDRRVAADRLEDVPTRDLLAILLAASGVHPDRIDLRPDRVEVSGAARGTHRTNPLSVIAIIAPRLPSDVRRLVFRLKRRGGTVVADVIVEPLRRFETSDGLAKNVAFVEFLARATLNGRPVFSRRHVRFMLARYVHERLEAPVAEVGDACRSCRARPVVSTTASLLRPARPGSCCGGRRRAGRRRQEMPCATSGGSRPTLARRPALGTTDLARTWPLPDASLARSMDVRRSACPTPPELAAALPHCWARTPPAGSPRPSGSDSVGLVELTDAGGRPPRVDGRQDRAFR